MSGHTPTPWEVCKGTVADHPWYVSGALRVVCDITGAICDITGAGGYRTAPDEAAKANAELIVRAVNSHEALVTALRKARDIAYHLYGDVEEPSDHWEECPSHDEDSYLYAVHEATCSTAAGKREGPWYGRADMACCDLDYEHDAAEMLAACECHVKELHGLVTMADAELAAIGAK